MAVTGRARVRAVRVWVERRAEGVIAAAAHGVGLLIGIGARYERRAHVEALLLVDVLLELAIASRHLDSAILGARGRIFGFARTPGLGGRNRRVGAMLLGLDRRRAHVHQATLDRVALVILYEVEAVLIQQAAAGLQAALGGVLGVVRANLREQVAVSFAVATALVAPTRPHEPAMIGRLAFRALGLVQAASHRVSDRLARITGIHQSANAEAQRLRRVDGVLAGAHAHHLVAVALAQRVRLRARGVRIERAIFDAGDRLTGAERQAHG